MISHRIELIVGFNAISMNTPLIYDAPTNCRKANNLRGLGVFHRSLDIDFQGIEAKINMAHSTVYHRDCAVMFGMSERVGFDRLARHDIFLRLAPDKGAGQEKDNQRPHSSGSFWTLNEGQALAANSLWPWTVAAGYWRRRSATRRMSAARCAGVRVSFGVLPSGAQPPM